MKGVIPMIALPGEVLSMAYVLSIWAGTGAAPTLTHQWLVFTSPTKGEVSSRQLHHPIKRL